jgi:hypothetical protein
MRHLGYLVSCRCLWHEDKLPTPMNAVRYIRLTVRCPAGGIALVAVSYAAYVGLTWFDTVTRCQRLARKNRIHCSDRFMPRYEAAERPHVRVAAPV